MSFNLVVLLSLLACVAGVSLLVIVRRVAMLRRTVAASRIRGFAELGRLAAGVAQEIQDPINTIRLNLHALEQLQQVVPGETDQPGTVIAEAMREVDRVEGLMQAMLGCARPATPGDEATDFLSELESTLRLIEPAVHRDGLLIRCDLPSAPLYVHLDRHQVRQIILNLLGNAREAAGSQGQILVTLRRRRRGTVELTVADSGPGVPPQDRETIFDPFHCTKGLATGLRLAVVKHFAEEAGGEAVCEPSDAGGIRFRVALPEFAAKGGPMAAMPAFPPPALRERCPEPVPPYPCTSQG